MLNIADPEYSGVREPFLGLGVIEKFISGQRVIKEAKKIFKKDPFQRIHLMDNFGIVNRMVAKSFSSIPVSVSAMAYQKNNLLYNHYLYLCYDHPNLTVIPYSLAYCNKLLELGIKEERVFHIPWGVPESKSTLTLEEKKKMKISLNLPDNKPLFLWAGYIQQIQRRDFLIALKAVEDALKSGLNAIFYFAFKPENFERDFYRFNNLQNSIYVTSTDIKKFDILKKSADIFYSPIFNKDCINAPPLTCIEVLSLGIPALTTDVAGAEKVISNGKTVYMVNSHEELLEKMFVIAKEYKKMIPYCREKIRNLYNIKNTTQRYLNLWFF